MPLKDSEKRKDAARDRQRKHRQGVTGEGVTSGCDKVEIVPASYVEGINGKMYQSLPEHPRYLKLPDGQVLDRLNQPTPNISGDRAMQACNESSYNFVPLKLKPRSKAPG